MNIGNKKIQSSQKTILWSFLSGVVLLIVKGTAGILGHSFALIADAIESFTDSLSSLLVYIGLRFANKPPDENHPYGHGKIEPMLTIMVAGFLVVSATIIAYTSIINIRTPHEAPASWTLIIILLIIVWKEISFQYIIRQAKKQNSSTLKAEAWHHRSDAISSFAALVGISISVYFGNGFEVADDWAALMASFIIVYNAYQLVRPAFGELMDEHSYDDIIDEIKKVSISVKGIQNTEKCFVRKSGTIYHVDLHAQMDSMITLQESHRLAHILKDTLKAEIPFLGHVMIHMEPTQK